MSDETTDAGTAAFKAMCEELPSVIVGMLAAAEIEKALGAVADGRVADSVVHVVRAAIAFKAAYRDPGGDTYNVEDVAELQRRIGALTPEEFEGLK